MNALGEWGLCPKADLLIDKGLICEPSNSISNIYQRPNDDIQL